ncbi:uncharacterized protein LOC102802867 [Saccoglossus kowalevskii]|uniref:Chloride channel CLIC-like protein 1 n=1 Tax=Saccoglossus kowalevskii TaxID=10224 RepID=A0ABM0MIA2_SACKO|nr:PREDICTED: uncharacterized protein LOC102802867 [Saccoglossus kowalevskii]
MLSEIVVVFFLLALTASQDFELKYTNKDGWVDPGDMVNYDSTTQTMRQKQPNLDQCNCDELNQNLAESVKEKEGLQNLLSRCDQSKRVIAAKCKPTASQCDCHGTSCPGVKDDLNHCNTEKELAQKMNDMCTVDKARIEKKFTDFEKLTKELEMCVANNKETARRLSKSCTCDDGKAEKKYAGCEAPHLKQFIRKLVTGMRGSLDADDLRFDFYIELTSNELTTLKKFIDHDDGNIHDVRDILVHMIQHIQRSDRSFNVYRVYIEEMFNTQLETLLIYVAFVSTLVACCFAVVTMEIRTNINWYRQIFKALVLLFFISIPWNWFLMYKKEVANKQSTVMKDIPEHCRAGDKSVFGAMMSLYRSAFSFDSNPCAMYHEAVLIDPLWEVAPSQAIAVTVSKFVFKPLELFGEAFGKFFNSFFKDLPMHVWPIATVLLVLFVVILLIMMFGYSIKFPFLGGIEAPDTRLVREQRQALEDNRARITERDREIERLQQQLRAIEERQLLEIAPPMERQALEDNRARITERDREIERLQQQLRAIEERRLLEIAPPKERLEEVASFLPPPAAKAEKDRDVPTSKPMEPEKMPALPILEKEKKIPPQKMEKEKEVPLKDVKEKVIEKRDSETKQLEAESTMPDILCAERIAMVTPMTSEGDAAEIKVTDKYRELTEDPSSHSEYQVIVDKTKDPMQAENVKAIDDSNAVAMASGDSMEQADVTKKTDEERDNEIIAELETEASNKSAKGKILSQISETEIEELSTLDAGIIAESSDIIRPDAEVDNLSDSGSDDFVVLKEEPEEEKDLLSAIYPIPENVGNVGHDDSVISLD